MSISDLDDVGVLPEQPILWLGMAGFSAEQRALLQSRLVLPDGHARWRVCSFGEADAWWINGAKATMADGGLRVAGGAPTERPLKLHLGEVDRPVAFALPLASAGVDARCTFDPASEASIQGALAQCESWLWLTRAEFVLGRRIVRREPEARRGVYHVNLAGKLLAVIDFQQGRAAILPRAHPVDLWEAQWDKRPVGAHDLPESFIPSSPAQLAWAYVRRTDHDLLPPRYRADTIHYRRAPGVPLRWLRDSQLMLLRELSVQPATLATLRQLTGLAMTQIEHDLTCLYYAGAITTRAGKSAARDSARRDSEPNLSEPGFESLLRADAHVQQASDLTAPARLERWRPR
ncbi:hypothetical protein [Caenimonas aquaedulcis]|uniref:Uncharacterized protein n=1 Tax=Caenimonas aquaedulcis TaxID=2793270 RepID=A0A931H784_9BURK|nr:hypothetical protein [Caenimonas aquaedulcis]MBG9389954.1 hypothetical protein [Caenimonas aquaedulcis]